MNPIALILLGSVALGWFLWLKSKPVPQQRIANLRLLVALLVALLFYLAVTGKLHWLGVVFAVLLPFARRLLPLLPIIGQLYSKYQHNKQTQGNTSEVNTRILSLTLDHDSGVMYGKVLVGPLAGRDLGNFSEQEFLSLLHYCRTEDAQSARLLETYLDKRFGDRWREDDTGSSTDPSAPLSDTAEAYQILGLQPGASKTEIIEAHRRLMQKIHPDRGGSDYLAAKINQAKDLLLDD